MKTIILILITNINANLSSIEAHRFSTEQDKTCEDALNIQKKIYKKENQTELKYDEYYCMDVTNMKNINNNF